MTYQYPYRSHTKNQVKDLTSGIDYIEVRKDDLDARISNLKGSFVEIGGPTDTGYYFLEGLGLPTEPIITNISPTPSQYSANADEQANQVSSLMDGASMPYKDASVGSFLMSSMSFSSDWWVNLSEEEMEKALPTVNEENNRALIEMTLLALGELDLDQVEYANRVKIYSEVLRCLELGGLFFADGDLHDAKILQDMGFSLAAYVCLIDEASKDYEFVFVKDSAN